MSPDVFHEQLEVLAAEYEKLERENQDLRASLLRRCTHHVTNGDSASVLCPHLHHEAVRGTVEVQSQGAGSEQLFFMDSSGGPSIPYEVPRMQYWHRSCLSLAEINTSQEDFEKGAEITSPSRAFQDEMIHGVACNEGTPPATLEVLPGVPAFTISPPTDEPAAMVDNLKLPKQRRPSQLGVGPSQEKGRRMSDGSQNSDNPLRSSPSMLSRRSSEGSIFSEISRLTQNSRYHRLPEFFQNLRGPLFANREAMKDKVRNQLFTEAYKVTNFYKDTGWCQNMARSTIFEFVTLIVIALNAVWIAVDTDFNKADILVNAHPVFQVAEHSFCTYFTLEILIRFGAFENKKNCFRDAWFTFDTVLVMIMVLETWLLPIVFSITERQGTGGGASLGNASVLRIVRLLRLTRMARMARLVRAMPELLILIKGMVAAARSVFFTLALLGMLLYVFAIAFTQLLGEYNVGNRHFHSVPKSMHTLWLYAALCDEITHLMREVEEAGLPCMLLLDVFILASTLTVMNMLVGVLCEVVGAVATSEKEELALSGVRTKVERIFDELGLEDGAHEGMLTRDQFQKILENREAARVIRDLGVDVVQMVDMADVFFENSESTSGEYKNSISFAEFMDALVSLRGSNFATVKDLVELRNYMGKQFGNAEEQTMKCLNNFAASTRSAAAARDQQDRGSPTRKKSVSGLTSSLPSSRRQSVDVRNSTSTAMEELFGRSSSRRPSNAEDFGSRNSVQNHRRLGSADIDDDQMDRLNQIGGGRSSMGQRRTIHGIAPASSSDPPQHSGSSVSYEPSSAPSAHFAKKKPASSQSSPLQGPDSPPRVHSPAASRSPPRSALKHSDSAFSVNSQFGPKDSLASSNTLPSSVFEGVPSSSSGQSLPSETPATIGIVSTSRCSTGNEEDECQRN